MAWNQQAAAFTGECTIMSDIKLFLEKSRDLIGDSDFEAVKDTLEALLKVNPDLVDSVFYERISRLVDSAQLARATQARIIELSAAIDQQKKSLTILAEQSRSMQASFDRVYSQMLRTV